MIKDTWVVFCVFSHLRVKRNKQRLFELFESFRFSGIENIIVVNNSGLTLSVKFLEIFTTQRAIIIDGTNENAEFSAWLEGISYINNIGSSKHKSNFILMNDTVFSNYSLYELKKCNFINKIVLSQSAQKKICVVGDETKLSYVSSCLNYTYDRFVCTALFYMDFDAAKIFAKSCNNVIEAWRINYDTKLNSFEMLSIFFDEAGAYDIGKWLFTSGWHSAAPSSDYDPELLRLKITAIACEHYFSASVLNTSGSIVDSNLYSELSLGDMLDTYKNLPKRLRTSLMKKKIHKLLRLG